MKNIKGSVALSAIVISLAGMPPSAHAAAAGHVQFVNGDVRVTNAAGQSRPAQKGDAINEGDTLTSAQKSSAQVKMQDGGFVAVREDTRLKFDQFVFAGKEDGSEKSFFSLFKGGFRAITGLIGRVNKQNYRITTPAATIGIRGTDHETFVVTPGSPLAQVAPAGAYSKVNVGETYMATEKGTIFVQPNQMGFAGGMNQMPQLQPLNTNIFTVAEAPTAEVKIEKKEEKKEEAKTEKAADGGTVAEGAAAQEEAAPVRETAVVDASPPATGSIPASNAPTAGAATADATLLVPVATTLTPPVVVAAGGQTVNLNTQTVAPAGGGTAVAITGNNPVYAALNGYGFEVLGLDSVGTWFNPFSTNLPGTSYLLDATNNLLEVLGSVKFIGGTALDTYKSVDGSVYMGRWLGGTATDPLMPVTYTMGTNSSQWVFAANPPVGYVQTLGGATSYTLTAATHPTDRLGNVGTLTAATLSADFTNQIVNISLALSFSTADPNFISAHNKAFTVTANGIPITAQEIWGVGTVACTGANCAAGGYFADIWARFAATAADKVAIPYDIWSNTVAADNVQGIAMVTAATPPVVNPVAPAGTVAAYVQTDKAAAFATTTSNYLSPFAEINSGIMAPADINNALPNPSFTERYAGKDPNSYIVNTLSGTTTTGETTTTLANGIQFGRYNSTQSTKLVVGNTYYGPAGTYLSPGPVFLHWITGPAVDPIYLPEVLLTANPAAPAVYTLAGNTVPTASFSGTATLNSASLTVDFTKQLVAFNLALTVGAAPWTASTTGTPLVFSYQNNAKTGFMATSVARPGWGPLTVTGATSGDVMGQLTGPGLDGVLLSYVLNGISDQVSGVVAFNGTPQAAPSYRLAGLSTTDANPPATQFPGGVYPGGVPVQIPVMLGGYNNSASVTLDGAGNLTGFRSDSAYGGGVYNVSKGAAVATGLGTDPISGISWGRWDNASFTSTNVATGAPGITNTGSAHWITSPVLTGPVTLPVTGVFNYVLAGGTAPTDSLGGVGTLNSATLSANFTAQTVSVGLNVTTPNAGNLIASAANLPIQQKSFFDAATAGAVQGGGVPGSLTITCGAGCTGTPQGQLSGVFAGPGGLGTAVLYGFAAGASNTTIVNGVAAFHR